MEKRYQVFVSSTFQDLQDERQEVMHALLELDCIPSGMELFPAANESQWSLIKRVIDDCDYYILILGGRYGSIGPEGISYTEMEYRYASSAGKPVIAFVHKDPESIASKRTEQSEDGKAKLTLFRELVQTKLCKHWTSPADLGSVVSRSLIHLIKTTPGIGWVRADELPDRDATIELLRLRKQVDELTLELQRSRTTAPKGTETLAQGDDVHSFTTTFQSRDAKGERYNCRYTVGVSWNQLFAALAPLMISESPEPELKKALTDCVSQRAMPLIRKDPDFKDHSCSGFVTADADFQTVKVQLRALGLIARSERSRSVKDTATYWCLTPYGDDLMTRLRAIKKSETTKPETNEA